MEFAAGWIALALRRDPERLDEWSSIPVSRPLRLAFVFAINLAGRSDDAVSLAERLFLTPEVIAALTTPRPEALAPTAAAVADFDRLWGAAFASGDAVFVEPILDALDRFARASEVTAPDLSTIVLQDQARLAALGESMDHNKLASAIFAGSALWSLCANGARHPFVYAAIDSRRARLAPVAADVLNACLAERLGSKIAR